MARLRPNCASLGLGLPDRWTGATPMLSAGGVCNACGWHRNLSSLLFGVVYVLDEPSAGLASLRQQACTMGTRPAARREATRCCV